MSCVSQVALIHRVTGYSKVLKNNKKPNFSFKDYKPNLFLIFNKKGN